MAKKLFYAAVTFIGLVTGLVVFLDKPIILAILIVLLLVPLGLYLSELIGLKYSWHNLRTIRQLGINRIYKTGNAGDLLKKKIKSANDIKIMIISGDSLIKMLKDEIVYALSKNKAVIKILIGTPASEFIKEVETAESKQREGNISSEIVKVHGYLNEYLEDASKDSGSIGSILGRNFNTQLRALVTIVNDEWAWVTPHVPPKRAVQSVSFELKKNSNTNSLLTDYIDHFDRIWKLNENNIFLPRSS
jgi:hypothetical protein